jgi:hypothetical protein
VEPRPGLGASALHQLQQAIHIDDYRSAGEAIIMLSTLANFKNESATPLRGEMIAVLRSYVQTHRLTLVNINYLTQQVLLVTGVEGGVRIVFYCSVVFCCFFHRFVNLTQLDCLLPL